MDQEWKGTAPEEGRTISPTDAAFSMPDGKTKPSLDQWLREIKAEPHAEQIGMYLIHNGVVRETARRQVREGVLHTRPVRGMLFSYDGKKVAQAIAEAKQMEGIFALRVWLNQGTLQVGDDIMMVLIGADIRPHAVDALQALVGRIKNECVSEQELYEESHRMD